MLSPWLKLVIMVIALTAGMDKSIAQTANHSDIVQQRLTQLSATLPALNQKVDLSVSGVTLQEYLRALGKASGLSISVDPALSYRISQQFNNVTALNVLAFLARQYPLEITNVGSILMISSYTDPSLLQRPSPKALNITYNQLNNTLSAELSNDTLSAVARKITQVSGKNVIIPAALQTRTLAGYVANAPFDAALEKMAYTNNLKVVRTNDGFYLFEALVEGEELFVNGDQRTAVRRTFKPVSGGGLQNSGLSSRSVNGRKLISADLVNAPIVDVLKSAALEMNQTYFLYADLKGNITAHVRDMGFEDFLTALFQGTEYTFVLQNGTYLVGDRKSEGLRLTRNIQLQNRSIDTVMTMIPAEWKRGVEIKRFDEQNTLVVAGPRPQVVELENYIHQLDVLVPQILIDVKLIDVRKTRTVSTGIKMGVADSVKTGGTVFPGLNYTFGSRSINDFLNRLSGVTSTNLGQVTPNFYAQLSALESNENVDVWSTPKLSTLNGHPALLKIGTQRYYSIRNQTFYPGISGTQNVTTQEYKETNANLQINIRPIVSGDDQVTLNIKVEISDFLGIPPNDAPPPKSVSTYESIVRAKTDDMIVLGGIERTEQSESGSGVPFLSRIPILKWLFSSRSKTNGKVVTLVLIKATIIR